MINVGRAPSVSELEVSVIGPGFGEAIVVHIGDGRWFLVDSCIDPATNQPAALAYLEALGVDYTKAVELIVVSHWHQDHIDGIDLIVGSCPNAKVVFSDALQTKEFLGLAQLHSRSPGSSGTEAFGRVLEILRDRKSSKVRYDSPKWAAAERILSRGSFHLAESTFQYELIALSPADATVLKSRLAVVEDLSRAVKDRRRVAFPGPNHASIVMWLSVGHHSMLFGSDLENTANSNEGWQAIVECCPHEGHGAADFFKIPHHGSRNAHHDEVWQQLLKPTPFAVLTPWMLGRNSLPTPEDVKRITSLTPHCFLTVPSSLRRTKLRDPAVRKTFNAATKSSRSLDRWGHVRLRRPLQDALTTWTVDLLGDAQLLVAET